MTRLLLVEDVFLLGHDDESGKNTASMGLQGAMAGALMLDLAEHGLITIEDDKVVPTGTTADHPLLQRAVDAVQEREKRAKVSHWLWQLPRSLKPFERNVGESLVHRGVLGEEQGKFLGLFNATRWPEVDPEPERQLRAELRDALLGETEPSARSLLLVGLLQNYTMIDRLVDKPERKQARSRARELVKTAESTDAISKAVGDNVRAAVMASVTAATVAATSASTTAVISSN